jgi:Tol biopolymer transport system component
VPVQLTDTDGYFEPGGSWLPDGSRFVYLQSQAGKASLMMVKTSGDAAPIVLRGNAIMYFLPYWSPTGDWITFRGDKGWNLISPDGKPAKFSARLRLAISLFPRMESSFTESSGTKLRTVKTGSLCFRSTP